MFGVIKEQDIIKGKEKVLSSWDKEFLIFDAAFKDNLEKIKRGAATAHLKDIGVILAYTGIGKNSIVLEAGSGSGQLTIMLANFVKKVYSYEIKKDFYDIVRKNIEKLEIRNIDLKLKDVYQDLEEKEECFFDLIVLDLNEPWRFLKDINKLKSGSYLVCYLPTIKQVERLVEEAKKVNLYFEKCIEILEREWFVEGLKVRPKNEMLGHTAFLVFFRKF